MARPLLRTRPDLRSGAVLTSIVVLHYGRKELTDVCVDSLRTGSELVIVDNAGDYANARADVLIRPKKNIGFARGCNIGARASTGDLIVFLNNDTVPHEGWLAALHRAFDEPDVGIAGGLLVYPNGEVQHAGVEMYRDNGTLHGRHSSPALAHARRDVEAVTGACLAIRRPLFFELGGFFEGYWNGNEDVDLCLQAGDAGWTVRYEPGCVVTHHESASGHERWSQVRENIELLNTRWHGKG